MLRQNIAIQAVPSDCSMWPPVGRGAERSNRPMLSRPRKPPSKMLRPLRVLAVHPPGEVQQELLEDAFEKVDRRCRRSRSVILVDAHCRPGVHRRIDVAESPFIGRQLAVRVHQPDLAEQQQLLLGEIGIDQRKRDQWKARSQAANQGYSHLSGIEMMSAALRWRQSLLRP